MRGIEAVSLQLLGRKIHSVLGVERDDHKGQLFVIFTDGTHLELSGWHLDGARGESTDRTEILYWHDRSAGHSARAFIAEDDSPCRSRQRRPSLGVAFRVPLLQILRESGGQAWRQDVLIELERRMRHEIPDIDRAPLASGAARWERSVVWEVRAMRREGLLLPANPAGKDIWALATKGQDLAQSLHTTYRAFLERTRERARER